MKKNATHLGLFLAVFAMTRLLTGCGGAPDERPSVSSKPEGEVRSAAAQSEPQKAAAAPAVDGAGKVVIGFSMGDLKEERWKRDRDLFKASAGKLGAKVLVQDAGGDAQAQIEQSKNLLLQGATVLTVIPKNARTAAPIVSAARAKSVPVVSYDRLVTGEMPDAYVSFDNVKVGEIQAAAVAAKVPKGKYLLLGGDPADNNSEQIRSGQMRALRGLVSGGAITIVAKPFCDKWSRAEATRYTEDALAQHPDLAAIVASNDGLAGGAIAALKAKGKQPGQIAVSGQDADLEAVRNVVAGWQTVTVYKPIAQLADAAALLSVGLGSGKKFDDLKKDLQNVSPDARVTATYKDGRWMGEVYLKPLPVTKENVDAVVVEGGFHSKNEVYGG